MSEIKKLRDGWQPIEKGGYQPPGNSQQQNNGYQPPKQTQTTQEVAPPPKKR